MSIQRLNTVFRHINSKISLPVFNRFSTTTWKACEATISREEKFASVGEFNLGYTQVGSGPHALLLLPGALGSGKGDFGPQLSGLDPARFTLVAWDPPGYGASRPPARTWPSDFFTRDADCAASLMQTLGFNKYSLLGWSDGGITSLIMAAKYSQVIHRMVVLGANAYVAEEDLAMYENVRDVSNWSARMREPLEKMYGVEGFPALWNDWLDAIFRYYTEKGGDLCKASLPQIRCPSLVIHGCKDAMVPQFHPDYLCRHISGARYYEFPDGKHNLHFKYAEEFNRVVSEFLLES